MTDPNDKLLYDPQLYHHLPPDERPSPFISDYKDIQVNTTDLESFAKSLKAELEQNYLPHRDKMATELSVGDVYTNEDFPEFIQALTRHAEIRQLTLDRLFDHGDGTGTLSVAADEISRNYAGSDAFSAATTRDVNSVIQTPASTTTTNDTPLNTSTVSSPNGAVTVPATTTTVNVPTGHTPGTTDGTSPTTTSASNPDNGSTVHG
jgi:hypothetical protein